MARTASAIVIRQQASKPARRRKSTGTHRTHEKLKKRIAALHRRARSSDLDISAVLATVGAPALVGYLAGQKGIQLPTVGGISPQLLWGAALALGAPSLLGEGKTTKLVQAAGVGMVTVAVAAVSTSGDFGALVRGGNGTIVGGDEIGADEIGDDEIGADEIGSDYETGDDEIGDDEIGDDD